MVAEGPFVGKDVLYGVNEDLLKGMQCSRCEDCLGALIRTGVYRSASA